MKVSDIKYAVNDGYPEMRCSIDGRSALISSDQVKRSLLDDENLVFLGPEWESAVTSVLLPADAATGRNAMTLRGYTRDDAVVSAVRDFLKAVDTGTLEVMVSA